MRKDKCHITSQALKVVAERARSKRKPNIKRMNEKKRNRGNICMGKGKVEKQVCNARPIAGTKRYCEMRADPTVMRDKCQERKNEIIESIQSSKFKCNPVRNLMQSIYMYIYDI